MLVSKVEVDVVVVDELTYPALCPARVLLGKKQLNSNANDACCRTSSANFAFL